MTPDGRIRILIVDDHAVFREALSLLLAAETDLTVADKCESVEQALAVVLNRPIDLVLLDLELAGHRGSGFCRLSRELGFRGRIIVLTAKVDSNEMVRLLVDGASGIFLKRTSPELLPRAIRKVAAGETWVDPTLLPDQPESAEAQAIRALAAREREVLLGVFEGLTNKEIGAGLRISEESVKASVQQLFAKLGVRTRVQLARRMMTHINECTSRARTP
jgi:DNA-binding NarL/FixJ family response regulator